MPPHAGAQESAQESGRKSPSPSTTVALCLGLALGAWLLLASAVQPPACTPNAGRALPSSVPRTSAKRLGNGSSSGFSASVRRIPFYMYEPQEFLAYSDCDISKLPDYKHGHVVFALEKFANHPWRTTMDKAEVVFVPALIDYISRYAEYGPPLCKGHNENQYVRDIADRVNRGGHFPAKRHFIIADSWQSAKLVQKLQKALPGIVIGVMENNIPQNWINPYSHDCVFALGYTTNFATQGPGHFRASQANPIMPLVQKRRAYFVEFSGQAQSNPTFADRYNLFVKDKERPIAGPAFIISGKDPPNGRKRWPARYDAFAKVSSCSNAVASEVEERRGVPGAAGSTGGDIPLFDRCVTPRDFSRKTTQNVRGQSNFSLVLRGDTAGADRWQNSIVAGTIPVGVGDSYADVLGWAPFQQVVDWAGMSIVIDRKGVWQESPPRAINTLLQIPEEVLAAKRQLMDHHRADLDWAAHGTRVPENVLLEAATCACSGQPRSKEQPAPRPKTSGPMFRVVRLGPGNFGLSSQLS